ncbi:MAG: hypothetical protein H6713_08810 [Myxococcales bacterium]|nr:hypothetical protein [Myxococcales bacterium]MCB9750088.1 hypothetical protein [Myxococcales bacterium]
MRARDLVVHVTLAVPLIASCTSGAAPTRDATPLDVVGVPAKEPTAAADTPATDTPADTPATDTPAADASAPTPAAARPLLPPLPAAGSPFEFQLVLPLATIQVGDASYWAVQALIEVPESRQEGLAHEPDGVTQRVAPEELGVADLPFTLGDVVTIVGAEGQARRTIQSFGIGAHMDGHELVGVLGPADEMGEGAIAVVGPLGPSASARVRTLERAPADAAVITQLDAELERSWPALAAGWSSEEDAPAPTRDEVALDPECVTRQSLRGPSGDDAILEVACGALEAKFLVGPRGRAPLQADVDAWTLDEAEHTLEALVDLDGDGVDELALRATAIERDAPYYLGWRDGGYAPLPGWDAHE